jgi:hypothetical protein
MGELGTVLDRIEARSHRRRWLLAVYVALGIGVSSTWYVAREEAAIEGEVTTSSNTGSQARNDGGPTTSTNTRHFSDREKTDATALPSPLFHQVLTTGTKTLSTINVRSIESLFYIYPNSRLSLHYNKEAEADPDHPRLKPLFDAGYNITLVPYDPAKQLRRAAKLSARTDLQINGTLAKSYIDLIKPKYAKEKFWYSNEANLLRLCLLYTVGGTYLDTDVVLTRSIDSIDNAVAGSKSKSIHCAVLRFTKPGNPYLAATIQNFMLHYNGEKWGNNGPSAFRRTAEEHPELVCPGDVGLARNAKPKDGKCYLNILAGSTFAPVRWRDWGETCSNPRKSPVGKDAKSIFKHSYAVHLNNQVTGPLLAKVGYVRGSVCEMILSDFCKVCP